MREFVWVESPSKLVEIVERAKHHDVVGLDGEMDSYYCYKTKLCLVQMGFGEVDVLIDSLSIEDLSPLNVITQDPSILKVFHAGENDVPYFRRQGVEFRNIFDTHLAARLLDLPSKSYGGLVQHYYDIELQKDQQRTDWRVRPLADEQIQYARQDTQYLKSLAEELQKALAEDELSEEAGHIFDSLEQLKLKEKPFDPDGWAKIKGSKDLGGVQRSILKLLVEWRDQVAKEEDLALFRVAHNGALISLSRKKFTEVTALKAWAKNNYFKKHAKELVGLLVKGRELGPIPFPARGKKNAENWSPQDEELFQKLRTWRNEMSSEAGIEPSRVFSNRQLKKMARSGAKNLKQLSALDGVEKWRVDKFGEQVVELLS